MFAFEFENGLFEFAYEMPACEPLFEVPPTRSNYRQKPFIFILF